MEDAATAEISRAQLWQWMHHSTRRARRRPPRDARAGPRGSCSAELARAAPAARRRSFPRRTLRARRAPARPASPPIRAFQTFLTLAAYRRDRLTASATTTHPQTFTEHSMTTAAESSKTWQTESALEAASRAPTRPRTCCGCAARVRDRAHARAAGRARSCGSTCNEKPFVNALGALTGNQAMQQVKAGLDAIYLSGWQVAGDANLSGQMYPDQSLYPADSVPSVVRRINIDAQARGRDPSRRGQRQRRLVQADRRRRRGRLRRRAQRVRADEADDRGGRCRRALRGPAVLGEEVRSHGRQGAGADAARRSTSSSRRGSRPTCATCRRCWWRAPMRNRRTCSPPTSTSATVRSSPAVSAPRKVSSA